MTLVFKRGKKHPLDLLFSFIDEQSGKLYKVSYPEIAMIIIQLMKNEDVLYPPERGLKGGLMLKEFIYECIECGEIPIPDYILSKYNLLRHKDQLIKVINEVE